jgi:hypothetical protein
MENPASPESSFEHQPIPEQAGLPACLSIRTHRRHVGWIPKLVEAPIKRQLRWRLSSSPYSGVLMTSEQLRGQPILIVSVRLSV